MATKTKKDWSLLIWLFGWMVSLVKSLQTLAQKHEVPFEAFEWLTTNKGAATLEKVVFCILDGWRSANKMKGFSAPITYTLPDYGELRERFAFQGVEGYGYPAGPGCRFKPIASCSGVSRTDRVVDFEYARIDSNLRSHGDILEEMDHLGLRPALYEELLGFGIKYPEEVRKFSIIALGSEMQIYPGSHYAAFLNSGRYLWLVVYDISHPCWGTEYRFLAVRKQSPPNT